MGIDYCVSSILSTLNYKSFKKVLTIGRQQIHGNFLNCNYGDYCEKLFTSAEKIDSIDASGYENCTIIHDLNFPMKSEIKFRNESKFDDTRPVYIITIAKKIKENALSFINCVPQQHNYTIE